MARWPDADSLHVSVPRALQRCSVHVGVSLRVEVCRHAQPQPATDHLGERSAREQTLQRRDPGPRIDRNNADSGAVSDHRVSQAIEVSGEEGVTGLGRIERRTAGSFARPWTGASGAIATDTSGGSDSLSA